MATIVMIVVCPPCLARVAYVDPFDPAMSTSSQTVVGQNPNGPTLRVVLAGASAASMKELADWTNQMARWLNPRSAIDPYDPTHFKDDLNRVLGADFRNIEYTYWNAPASSARVDLVLTLEISVVLGKHSFGQNRVELDGTLSTPNAASTEKLVGLGQSKVGFPAFVTHFEAARVGAFDQFGQSLRGSRLIASYQPGRTAPNANQSLAGDASGNASPSLEGSSNATKPAGLYAVDANVPFNVLDSVYFDPASGKLALIGHHDDHFTGPAIPYLQYLATLLENPKPEFSLDWTPESAQRVDALLASELTQQDSDAQAARLAAMVDASGTVTHVGALMLPALGIYPIQDNRAPGDMGVQVESINGGRVVLLSVKPGSAADKAGLKPADFIAGVKPGQPVFFQSEFARQVRFAGAGSEIQVTYQRDNGAYQTTTVTLDAADDADPWQGVNRYDLISMMYRGAGDPQPAEVVDAFEVFNAMTTQNENKAGWLPYTELMRAMAMGDDFQQLQQAGNGGAPPYQDAYNFGLKFARQLDSIFHFAGNPLQQTYENSVAQSHDPASALPLVLKEFDTQLTPKVSELIGRLISRPGVGFQIPPELVEDEYHIHPEMTPEYLGVPAHSLLAKLMLESDYLCKRLSNQQDLKTKIPGYQTMVEYQVNHPDSNRRANSAYRVWTSVATVDAAQSNDGRTLALRNATMRFNIRKTGTGLQHQDLPGDQGGGYQDVLTGLYDQFEQQFPTLHELREAAKLATASIWLQQKQPAFDLPADGRVSWDGPQTVPGLVYIYLTTDLQQQSRIFKIAEGGVSIEPPHEIPTDPSVVDLRTTPIFTTLFTHTDSAPAPSWVSPVESGAHAQQALVVDTHTSSFGTRVPNPVLTTRGQPGAVGAEPALPDDAEKAELRDAVASPATPATAVQTNPGAQTSEGQALQNSTRPPAAAVQPNTLHALKNAQSSGTNDLFDGGQGGTSNAYPTVTQPPAAPITTASPPMSHELQQRLNSDPVYLQYDAAARQAAAAEQKARAAAAQLQRQYLSTPDSDPDKQAKHVASAAAQAEADRLQNQLRQAEALKKIEEERVKGQPILLPKKP